MKAFEVHLNGRYLLTAGVGPDGVLASVVSWVGGESLPNAGLHFHVGGVDGSTGEHVDWSVPSIAVGDAVTIKVVEANVISVEHHRQTVDRALLEARLKRQREQAGGDTA